MMINFFKKWSWLFMGVAAVVILTVGFDFARSYFREKAFAAAAAKYEKKLRDAEEKIAAKEKAYGEFAEKAGRDRETMRLSAEEALRKAAFNFEKYKSRSSEELQAKKAAISEVLAEKKKDEVALVEAKGSINYLGTLCFMTLKAWSISDENKDRAHAEVVAGLEEKFSACDKWRTMIEKELRPTFWKKAKEAGKLALAFSAGYITGSVK
jgi:hypothetical protein